MKEKLNSESTKAVEGGGSKSLGKQVALKDFKQTRRGEVYVAVKKGDDCSKLDKSRKALLKANGVI